MGTLWSVLYLYCNWQISAKKKHGSEREWESFFREWTGRDIPPVFSWDWDGKRYIFVGVGRERFENSLPCHPLTHTHVSAVYVYSPLCANWQIWPRSSEAPSTQTNTHTHTHTHTFLRYTFTLLCARTDRSDRDHLKLRHLMLYNKLTLGNASTNINNEKYICYSIN